MSRKTELVADLMALSKRCGGSHLTREARGRTLHRLARLLVAGGYSHIRRAADLRLRHIRFYVREREHATSVRTRHNEMAHIRNVLRAAGKHNLADAPEMSNSALGLTGARRIGTKTALREAEYLALISRAKKHQRVGIAAVLQLEWHIGLRGNEAIHATADVCERWLRELAEGNQITVADGTKGGRRRDVFIHRKAETIATIVRARAIAHAQGGYLIIRANGTPAGGLKQARSIYRNWCYRAGVQAHAIRYRWADRQLDAYVDCGYKVRDARRALAVDLGHGRGRDRYVTSVYCRRD